MRNYRISIQSMLVVREDQHGTDRSTGLWWHYHTMHKLMTPYHLSMETPGKWAKAEHGHYNPAQLQPFFLTIRLSSRPPSLQRSSAAAW